MCNNERTKQMQEQTAGNSESMSELRFVTDKRRRCRNLTTLSKNANN